VSSAADPGQRRGLTSPLVSVVVPCRNEARYIRTCLESITRGNYPRERIEVLVIDGMSDDGTRECVAAYAAEYPSISMLDNPKRITPCALNIGIRAARGEVIVRMDAHVVYPPEYISRVVTALEESGADNVGGVLVTLPGSHTPTARAIAIAMSHPFGVGNSYFRIGVRAPRWVDTIAFFCCRKTLFERIGLFDEELVRNQDGEFNSRLIRRGGRILLLPDVQAYYYARRSLRQVARMYYQYGYFKPLVAKKIKRFMTVRQMVPALFILGLLGTSAVAVWWPAASVSLWGLLGSYAAAVLACAAHAVRKHGVKASLVLVAVFPVLHFSYGFGFLQRIVELHVRFRSRAPDAAELPLSR